MGNLKFIKCGKLFDGVNRELKEGWNILVDDKVISAIGPDIACPEGAEVIDLSGLTVTPGLIDAHVHFDFVGKSVTGTLERLTWSNERKTFHILYCAQKALERGFTTTRIFNSAIGTFGVMDAKRVINEGLFPGARIITAPNTVTTSGGHSDKSSYMRTNPQLAELMEPLQNGLGNGPDYYRAYVRKQVKYGADLIKIMATGGFSSPNDGPEDCQLDQDELRAIIDTAHQVHSTVTAHAYTSELVSNLVNLGIDGIEHGAMIDRATADLMLEKGTYLVPTMVPYEDIIHPDPEKLKMKQPAFRNKLIKYADRLRETRQLICQLIAEDKMTIGYGTDIVRVFNNYDCWHEFETWRANGIDALTTLRAATSVNARIVHQPDIGALEVGKIADIAAWGADILNDVEALRVCDFVMKEGTVYKKTRDDKVPAHIDY